MWVALQTKREAPHPRKWSWGGCAWSASYQNGPWRTSSRTSCEVRLNSSNENARSCEHRLRGAGGLAHRRQHDGQRKSLRVGGHEAAPRTRLPQSPGTQQQQTPARAGKGRCRRAPMQGVWRGRRAGSSPVRRQRWGGHVRAGDRRGAGGAIRRRCGKRWECGAARALVSPVAPLFHGEAICCTRGRRRQGLR